MSDHTATPGVKRREFLQVLGAAGAAAATVGCTSEKVGKLIPYVVSPENTIPGVSTYYATTCRECAAGCGVIAETREGRVVKLEGNPDHPLNRGALCARGQSALQGLYNPDRIRTPMLRKTENGPLEPATWDDALAFVAQRMGGLAGGYFISRHEGGTFGAFLDGWLGAVGMRPLIGVDLDADDAALQGNRAAYGAAMPRFNFGEAQVIVSFGADFLDGWGASVPQQLDFAEARSRIDRMPLFIYVGARRSLTGLNADQWIGCRPGSEGTIAAFLRGQGSSAAAAQASGIDEAVIVALGETVRGKTALYLSGVRGAGAGDMQSAVAALNAGAGAAIRGGEGALGFEGMATPAHLQAALEAMRAGGVPAVMFRGVNPVHELPAASAAADAIAKVPLRISFALYPDETTELCNVVFPDHHPLESWDTVESVRGTVSVQQPVMDPVFPSTRHAADVLMMLAQRTPAIAGRFGGDYKAWFLGRAGDQQAFAGGLAKGTMTGSLAARAALPAMAAPAVRPATASAGASDFYFMTYPSPTLGMGGGANKPWLQELPDPVTKVCWGSVVEMHPETARRLDVERGDMVRVTAGSVSITAPAYPYLGIRPDTVAIAMGQGHRSRADMPKFKPLDETQPVQWGYGRYARNIGVNPMDLITAAGPVLVKVERTGEEGVVATTEGSARQHGRGIAQATTVAALMSGADEGGHGAHDIPGAANTKHDPGLRPRVAADAQGELGSPTAANRGTNKGMYDPAHPSGMTKRRWAMTIDLARCTGCSACVTACYAENNIPTVGAPWQNATVFAVEQAGFNITRGREMNWLRIERYYEGNTEAHFGTDFETRFVPMLCQHCGNAPCEPVCPVYATYHAPDGLNVQVYNRCVGTRYCSNNCPYKVRYFNWFGYGEPDRKQYAFPEPLHMQLNPDVTVRAKGVMEKCTFCVQRIREAENLAALEHREVQPDEFTTACAQACPSRAIVFGDAADPQWTVAQLAHDRRAYHVFEELNTFTAVVYLKKVNPVTTGAAAAAPAAH